MFLHRGRKGGARRKFYSVSAVFVVVRDGRAGHVESFVLVSAVFFIEDGRAGHGELFCTVSALFFVGDGSAGHDESFALCHSRRKCKDHWGKNMNTKCFLYFHP